MTTISAKVIADSIGEDAPRLVTIHARYPRFIHAEMMTHRVFSRNARSSRAVPIAKMIEEVENDPVVPMHWGAAQAGMQAYAECEMEVGLVSEEFGILEHYPRETAWLYARDQAAMVAKGFMEAGYAKQLANRLLEPFLHIDTLVTATEWTNFFALRDHDAAEPHIQMLARAIRKAMEGSEPTALQRSEWHLPYVDAMDAEHARDIAAQHMGIPKVREGDELAGQVVVHVLRHISAARCARISYKSFDGGTSPREDVQLAERLATSGHWSPFEHQATPDRIRKGAPGPEWLDADDHGNFTGWRQSRRILEAEMARKATAA